METKAGTKAGTLNIRIRIFVFMLVIQTCFPVLIFIPFIFMIPFFFKRLGIDNEGLAQSKISMSMSMSMVSAMTLRHQLDPIASQR